MKKIPLTFRTMLLMSFVLKRASELFFALILFGVASCTGFDPAIRTGTWYKQSDFEGAPRSNAVAFTINRKPYIGGGFNTASSSTPGKFLNDFWTYNPEYDLWTKIAPFPGAARSQGVAFSANGKGYVGLGQDGTNYYNDFWEYDPSVDKWKRVADFAGSKRFGSVAFSINDIGYVGTGLDSAGTTKDFYSYDAASNTWSQRAGIGTMRTGSFVFVIDGVAYIGGGANNNAADFTFFSYNPADDRWTEEFDLQDDGNDLDPNDKGYYMGLQNSATFVIGSMGYLVGGDKTGVPVLWCWRYNPSTKTWVRQTDMLSAYAGARDGAVGYTIDDQGYVATGRNGNTRLDDIWSFDPTPQ
jgi:N-acetylneuraminic acid mutarotase